jgi:hypothetical protein
VRSPIDWSVQWAPKIVRKSFGSFGNRLGSRFCSAVTHRLAASELNARKSAIVTTNTPACDRFATGRINVISTVAPSRKPNTTPIRHESTNGSPQSCSCHTMNVENIPISPWAKFNCPVPRKMTTSPSASRAYTAPLESPSNKYCMKRSI